MDQAKKTYQRLLNTIKSVKDSEITKVSSKEIKALIIRVDETKSKIIKAMDDDFDTPVAIAEILTLFREINKVILQENMKITSEFKVKFLEFIDDLEQIFGVFPDLDSKLSGFSVESRNEKDKLIQNLIALITEIRSELRTKKLFEISDIIRDKLRELGITLEDKKV